METDDSMVSYSMVTPGLLQVVPANIYTNPWRLQQREPIRGNISKFNQTSLVILYFLFIFEIQYEFNKQNES